MVIDRFVARAPWWVVLLVFSTIMTGAFAVVAALDDVPNWRLVPTLGPVLGIGLAVAAVRRRRRAERLGRTDR